MSCIHYIAKQVQNKNGGYIVHEKELNNPVLPMQPYTCSKYIASLVHF